MGFAEHFAIILEELRLWLRTTSFAPLVPRELQSATGYRTDSTDTRVADAICGLWQQEMYFDVIVSKRQLGRAAGVSCNAAVSALKRLSGWYTQVDRLETESGDETGCFRLRLGDTVSSTLTTLQHLSVVNNDGGQSRQYENVYASRKCEDVFMSGTSKTVRGWASSNAESAGMTTREWLDSHTGPGLGEGALRAIDALGRCAEMTAVELAEETGKTLGSVRRVLRRLELSGIVDVERTTSRAPKVYTLHDDWEELIREMAPMLRTYQISVWREERELQGSLRWLQHRKAKTKDAEEEKKVRFRFFKLRTRRKDVLVVLHPWMTDDEAWRLAGDVVADVVRMRPNRMYKDPMATSDNDYRLWQEWDKLDGIPEADRFCRLVDDAGWQQDEVHKMLKSRLPGQAKIVRDYFAAGALS